MSIRLILLVNCVAVAVAGGVCTYLAYTMKVTEDPGAFEIAGRRLSARGADRRVTRS